MSTEAGWLASRIREVPDFPQPGISFKDISPLLRDGAAFARSIDELDAVLPSELDVIAGIDARGFIFGAALARQRSIGFVPIRKPGKLPGATRSVSYDLEYGSDTVELSEGIIGAGDRIGLVDDVLATGGTAAATAELIRSTGADLVAAAFVIELAFLPGRATLTQAVTAAGSAQPSITSLITFD